MNKLMIVVGMLSGMSLPSTSEIKKDGTRVDIIEKVFLSEAIDNIQDQETWIREDINNGTRRDLKAIIMADKVDKSFTEVKRLTKKIKEKKLQIFQIAP